MESTTGGPRLAQVGVTLSAGRLLSCDVGARIRSRHR